MPVSCRRRSCQVWAAGTRPVAGWDGASVSREIPAKGSSFRSASFAPQPVQLRVPGGSLTTEGPPIRGSENRVWRGPARAEMWKDRFIIRRRRHGSRGGCRDMPRLCGRSRSIATAPLDAAIASRDPIRMSADVRTSGPTPPLRLEPRCHDPEIRERIYGCAGEASRRKADDSRHRLAVARRCAGVPGSSRRSADAVTRRADVGTESRETIAMSRDFAADPLTRRRRVRAR
jgi:hypothetical protein